MQTGIQKAARQGINARRRCGGKCRRRLFMSLCLSVACFALFAILAFPPAISSQNVIRTVNGIVVHVSDGDSMTVQTREKTKLKVRLYGIDAPETPKYDRKTGRMTKPGQPLGIKSKSYLSSLILQRTVQLDVVDIDSYRRMVAIVRLDDRNINLEMIRAGMAEAYVEYLKGSPYREAFLQAEREARENRRGIWSRDQYERPRDFKRRLRVN